MTNGQQVLFPTSVELRLTVDPPEDVEGGPQIQVRGQGVPEESHPHCGALRLEDQRQNTRTHVSPGTTRPFRAKIKRNTFYSLQGKENPAAYQNKLLF